MCTSCSTHSQTCQIKPTDSYGESASYSKRSISRSSYGSAENGLSSRSSIRSSSSGRYGTEVGLADSNYSKRSAIHSIGSDGGRHGDLSSSYSRRVLKESSGEDDGALSSSYYRTLTSETKEFGDGLSSSYAKKYLSSSGDDDSHSYGKITMPSLDTGDNSGSMKYSRKSVISSGEGDITGSLTYARKSHTTYVDDDYNVTGKSRAEDDVQDIVERYSRRSSKEASRIRSSSIGSDDETTSKFSKYERHLSRESIRKSSLTNTEEDAAIEAEMRKKYAPDSTRETSATDEKISSSSAKRIYTEESDSSYRQYGKLTQNIF